MKWLSLERYLLMVSEVLSALRAGEPGSLIKVLQRLHSTEPKLWLMQTRGRPKTSSFISSLPHVSKTSMEGPFPPTRVGCLHLVVRLEDVPHRMSARELAPRCLWCSLCGFLGLRPWKKEAMKCWKILMTHMWPKFWTGSHCVMKLNHFNTPRFYGHLTFTPSFGIQAKWRDWEEGKKNLGMIVGL